MCHQCRIAVISNYHVFFFLGKDPTAGEPEAVVNKRFFYLQKQNLTGTQGPLISQEHGMRTEKMNRWTSKASRRGRDLSKPKSKWDAGGRDEGDTKQRAQRKKKPRKHDTDMNDTFWDPSDPSHLLIKSQYQSDITSSSRLLIYLDWHK